METIDSCVSDDFLVMETSDASQSHDLYSNKQQDKLITHTHYTLIYPPAHRKNCLVKITKKIVHATEVTIFIVILTVRRTVTNEQQMLLFLNSNPANRLLRFRNSCLNSLHCMVDWGNLGRWDTPLLYSEEEGLQSQTWYTG